jgi:hypothetical protein
MGLNRWFVELLLKSLCERVNGRLYITYNNIKKAPNQLNQFTKMWMTSLTQLSSQVIYLGREGMTELKTSGLGERSIEDIDPSAYSASFIRGLVKNGQREEFNQVYSRYLPPEEIQKMFETIQIGIQMKSYGFSFDEIRKASSLLKINLNADGYPKHVWPDNHVHEYSYAEQHLVFKDIRHRKKHGSDKYDTVQSGYEPGFYSIYSSFPF